jgi:hypothetical protein
MVGVGYTLVWPEDQVGLAPTGAPIRGSLARVGRIDRRTQEVTSRLDALCTLVTIDS